MDRQRDCQVERQRERERDRLAGRETGIPCFGILERRAESSQLSHGWVQPPSLLENCTNMKHLKNRERHVT